MTEKGRRAAWERRAPDSITKRFFYHSFPFQDLNCDEDLLSDGTIERGLATLTGIAEIGLLLTPEKWLVQPEDVVDGPKPKAMTIY